MKPRYLTNSKPYIPVGGMILWWLLLDRIHAPGWVWGVVGTFFALVSIINAFILATGEGVDVLKDRR